LPQPHLPRALSENLTEDRQDYTYYYDYENRLVKVRKSGDVDVAEFFYDALGRRICKVDWLTETGIVYYNNDNWQVLCEYDAMDGAFEQWYAYGNYIDEVLIKGTTYTYTSFKYYIHDHLYSPVALASYFGVVQERYEYDAYGNPHIMDASYGPRSTSLYGNSYLFTGRELDILDYGSLKIQYNRNRYYDSYTGRWTTHDPLGIAPDPQFCDGSLALEECQSGSKAYESPEVALLRELETFGATQSLQNLGSFDPPKQYYPSLSLYEYVNSHPVVGLDPSGKFIGKALACAICSAHLAIASRNCGRVVCGHICDEYSDDYCKYSECMEKERPACMKKCVNGIAKGLKSCVKCAYAIPK
jgi:RHS repeat-associated protein